jgi:hypothetical protein
MGWFGGGRCVNKHTHIYMYITHIYTRIYVCVYVCRHTCGTYTLLSHRLHAAGEGAREEGEEEEHLLLWYE